MTNADAREGAKAGTVLLHSEEAIIQRFLAPLAAGFPGALGLQDDCAVAAPSAGCEFVFKTDAIAEGVHFLSEDPPADIGWKALAVNISDLAAKAATPIGTHCRICERLDCDSRAFPPIRHRLIVDENKRGRFPYHFSPIGARQKSN